MEQDMKRLFEAGARVISSLRQDLIASIEELSIPQFRVLAALKRSPELSLADQARLHGVTPPAMSKIVEALVQKGLLEREIDEADRRINRHRLTDTGQAISETAERAIIERLVARMSHLSATEQKSIAQAVPALEKMAVHA